MNNIIRGYWKCSYCDTPDINGLDDVCPNCGRHKPENTKYYMKFGADGRPLQSDVLSEKEMNEAGISLEECDGDHKEWICDYCNSLNNWADQYCKACNSLRDDATKEYGMENIGDNQNCDEPATPSNEREEPVELTKSPTRP